MRYILVDPHSRTVTDATDPRLDTEPRPYLDALYEIMDCYHVEWHEIGSFKPKHILILDERGMMRNPPSPTFTFNGIPCVGKAVVTGLGRGKRSSRTATVPLPTVKALVNFDVPPRRYRAPTVKTFATPQEMMADMAARRGKGGF